LSKALVENLKSTAKRWFPVAGSLTVVAVLFGYQALFQGGSEHPGPDGRNYIAAAQGQPVIRPFNSRVLAPLAAASVARVTRLTVAGAFILLTVASLFGALVMLAHLLARAGAPARYQACIILAFGAGMAVLFGHSPVLVDPEVLFFSCLTLIALDRGMVVLALAGVCLAALTKEHGIALVLPWAVETFRKSGWRPLVGALIPVLLLVSVTLLPALPNPFYTDTAKYQMTLLSYLGPSIYLKTIYIWAWVAMWPVLLVSALELFARIKKPSSLRHPQIWYGAMMVAVPVLLMGDWDRAFMLLVPLACLACAASSFAADRYRCILLALGGFATALARPYYTVTAPPRVLMIALIGISAAASGLIAFDVAKRYGMQFLRLQSADGANSIPQAGSS
jgi:hypothetical protein